MENKNKIDKNIMNNEKQQIDKIVEILHEEKIFNDKHIERIYHE